MKIINKSHKIIGINGEALLPGAEMTLPEGAEKNPNIKRYLAKGSLADANAATVQSVDDEERARIAEAAIEQYKAEAAALEAEIKAVKSMKKDDLVTKALAMGIEISDEDSVATLKEKIIAVLSA